MHRYTHQAFAALLGLCMASAMAASPDPAFDAFMSRTVGNSTTLSFAGNGTPLVASSSPLGQPSIGQFGVSRTAQGVFMESIGGARVPGTNTTISVKGRIQLSGQVIGKTLARAVLLYTAWEAGSALYDIWADAGLSLDLQTGAVSNPSSSLPNSVVSDGRRWRTINNPISRWTRQEACHLTATTYNNIHFTYVGTAGATCSIRRSDGLVFSESLIDAGPSSCPSGWFVTSPTTCIQSLPPSQLTPQQIADHIAARSAWPDSTITEAVRDALLLPGVAPEIVPELAPLPVDVQFPSGAPVVEVGQPETRTITRTLPNGDTEETTRTTTRTARPTPTSPGQPNAIRWDEETTERRIVRAPNGTVISDEVTQTETQPSSDGSITCGLPNTPPCKIDETGTPEPPEDNAEDVFTLIFRPLTTCAADIPACLPDLPELNLAFNLPTTCGLIRLEAFEPYIQPIDLCQWRPMFHDIMSLIWAAAGLFGAMAIVSRNPFS